MLRRLLPILALLLSSLAGAAQPTLVQSPAVVVRAPVATGQWQVIDSALARLQPQMVDGGAAVLLVAPGKYVVVWAGPGGMVAVDVTVGVPGPLPKPPKPPVPPKPAPPVPDVTPAAKIWISILREEQDATVPQSRVIAAGEAWASARKHEFRTLDETLKDRNDKPSPEILAIKSWIVGTPLPAVVIQDAAGKHLGHFALPDTGEKFTAELQRWGK